MINESGRPAVNPPDCRGRSPILVVTTCSAGKRCRTPISAADLPRGSQADVARAWRACLTRKTSLQAAERLYKGRAFTTARAAAQAAKADFGVLSAGLGYVEGQSLVPGYDLTVRPGTAASVRARVDGAFEPGAWWRAVARGPFSSSLRLSARGRRLVLIALSRSYLEMLADDLIAIARDNPDGLRLFGQSLADAAPAALIPCVMPYDDRLERIGAAGTRSDFAPRAMSDFLTAIHPLGGDRAGQARAVLDRMAAAPPPQAPRLQRRADDATLMSVIRDLSQELGPRSAEVLLTLRRREGWSCEQGRFARLFRSVHGQKEQAL